MTDKNIGQLIKKLTDQDRDIRVEAARALGKRKSEKAMSALRNALNDPEIYVRTEAANSLAEILSMYTDEPLPEIPDGPNLDRIKKRDAKILVINDEADIRKQLCDFLKREGCQTATASNTFDGLVKFKEIKPDLVLTDLRMSGKTGLELFHDIKKVDSSIPIILIITVKDIPSAISAISKGVFDYIVKPIKLRDLERIISNALGFYTRISCIHQYKCFSKLIAGEIKVLERTADQLRIKNKYSSNDDTSTRTDTFKAIYGAAAHSLKGEFMHIANSVEEIRYLNDSAPEILENCETVEKSLILCQKFMQRLLNFLDMGEYWNQKTGITSLLEKNQSLADSRFDSKAALDVSDTIKEIHSIRRTKKKILFVDDCTKTLFIYGDILKLNGYDVSLANNASEGINFFLRDQPDLVISDIRMPGKTGLEFLNDIKIINPLIPVILISGIRNIESTISAITKGAFDYCSKLWDTEELLQLTKKALNMNTSESEHHRYSTLLNSLVAKKGVLQKKIVRLKNNTAPSAEVYKNTMAIAAHGLRYEFARMELSVNQIRSTAADSPDTLEECDVIERSLTFSRILMRRLLDFLDVGKYRKEKVSIRSLVNKTKSLIMSRLRSNIQLNILTAPRIMKKSISANLEQLVGVILELINNAANAMNRTGGTIELDAREAEENLLITIKDNGPGIPRDIKENIFQKQVTSKTGSGFGLFLCRKVIHGFGGQLNLTDTSGPGTEFQIIFPKNNRSKPEPKGESSNE